MRKMVVVLLTPINRMCQDKHLLLHLYEKDVVHFGDFLFHNQVEFLAIERPELRRLFYLLESFNLTVGQFTNDPVVKGLFKNAVRSYRPQVCKKVLPLGAGNPHPAHPKSQAQYEGSNFVSMF